MKRALRIILPLLILAAGVVLWRVQLKEEEPEPFEPRKRAEVETEVEVLVPVDYPVQIRTQGTVQPHNQTTVTAGVSGRVVETSRAFETGAFFREGEILVTLDDADFQSSVASAEARLAGAQANLLQEESRSRQALLNWNDLGYDEAPSDLVLRKPQLKQAEADVAAAQAALDQARRDLERTRVRAPYNGRTRERSVSVGQSIGATTDLGTVFSTDFAELRLPVSQNQLQMVTVPEDETDPALPMEVKVQSGSRSIEREGLIVRTEGAVDEATRELFVIGKVEDPFGLQNGEPPLRVGQPVRVDIAGRVLESVFVIPRKVLRSLDEIIIIDDENKIGRRRINPVWATLDDLIVEENLEAGEKLALSPLTYAPEGGKVKIVTPEPEANAALDETASETSGEG